METTLKNKNPILREFRNGTGLLVDLLNADYGNTNVGNSARRFYLNPEQYSQIMNERTNGVNEQLIKRLSIILKTLASGQKINVESLKVTALRWLICKLIIYKDL